MRTHIVVGGHIQQRGQRGHSTHDLQRGHSDHDFQLNNWGIVLMFLRGPGRVKDIAFRTKTW
jgi:hypothetical protein